MPNGDYESRPYPGDYRPPYAEANSSRITSSSVKVADDALTFLERAYKAPAPVLLSLVIAVLLYYIWYRDKKYVALAKMLSRAKAVMAVDLAKDKDLTAMEAEQRVSDHLERK